MFIRLNTCDDGHFYCNPDFITGMIPVNKGSALDKNGVNTILTILTVKDVRARVHVRETTEQITLMTAALDWKAGILHVGWDWDKACLRITSAEDGDDGYIIQTKSHEKLKTD